MRGSIAQRMIFVLFALALVFSCVMPTVAFAAAASSEQQDSDDAAQSSSRTESAVSDVLVSADGSAGTIEGCPFALDAFNRAQVGSNREVEGSYRGYTYYAGSSPDYLTMAVAEDYAVVFVPEEIATEVGLSIENEQDIAYLKAYLEALDTAVANGGATVSAQETTWYFTEKTEYKVNDVVFTFAQELKAGQYYTCVIGADGSDVTDLESPSYVKLSHADFGELVKAANLDLVLPATGIDAFVEFMQSIDYSPLWVTLKTTGTAIVFIFILGLAAAYFSLRIPARAQDIADSIFTIPMVLPPTVCGFLLLLAFGRNTGIGQWFIDIGFPLIFSWPATVIAAVVVAFPLMYRSARGAFEGLDPTMLDAARTLGWSNAKIFFKLMLPLSWSSIAAGTVLAFARALGEFGATLFLAGNYLGVTRTIPIAIYFEWMNGNTDIAIFWTIVIMIFSFIVILFINLWSR
ncbi:MAG: molybdate ABC transporter permease subunit, partial [Raoultibacter sp.]